MLSQEMINLGQVRSVIREMFEYGNKRAAEIGREALVEGAIGQVHGCDVVISNRVTDTNYIVKPGAVSIFLKRETSLETERIPSIRATELTVDKHYTVHLADVTKAIKITNA